MGLIVVKAKVRMFHESEIEQFEKNQSMGIEMGEWKWREMAIHTDDIKRIIQYNSKKTVIEDYYDRILLVQESFEDVYRKWDENKETSIQFDSDLEEEDESDEEE